MGWPTPKLGRTELASQIFTGTHLSERHREIFIISLGELILSGGIGLAGSGFQAGPVTTSFVGFASAVVLFQLYFHRVEQLLAPPAVTVVERVRPGTSTSYSHLVMVAGVLLWHARVRVGDAVFGPRTDGETTHAGRLLRSLHTRMIVLLDRGFDSNTFLGAVAGTGAQFLVRLNGNRKPPVLARHHDGSYTSVIGGCGSGSSRVRSPSPRPPGPGPVSTG
ncbi:low temperature requirement protein A [Micromonospora sp. MH33]|uniref:low temperature requirement protein A n=1 Tax=Micromonospora sp. MH33 TaxID=1945509 RepID=UPI00143DF02E|nr:low temperature requirement protein A [Micromonospora sp. MH33]